MTGYRSLLGAVLLVVSATAAAQMVRADEEAPPQVGNACAPDLAGAMTLLPDQTTYVNCQQAGPGFAWTVVQTPFPPNDAWLSYGPPITLHGQAMRNPNLTSGPWRATPRNPETTCGVTQTTVVEAGVLAEPQVFQGEKGQPLAVRMQPQLFYAELAGDCLWARQLIG